MPWSRFALYVLRSVHITCSVTQEVHATEWQICWAAPSSDTANFGARPVLRLLHVNPQPGVRSESTEDLLPAPASASALQQQPARQDDVLTATAAHMPLPLPVPWTILMSAAHLQLTVLASAGVTTGGAAASSAHEAAIFDIDGFQVGPHTRLTMHALDRLCSHRD
jgi:hypothetical protein